MGFNYAKYKAAVIGSPLNKNGFGPKEQEKTTTGDSGSLRDVITNIKDKATDVLGNIETKAFEGTEGPVEKAEKNWASDNPINNILYYPQMVVGGIPGAVVGATAHIGKKILENLKAPSTPTGAFGKKKNSPVPKKKELTPFENAFAKARKEGKDTFMFEGKEYGTALKGESKIYKADYQKGTDKFNYVGPDGKITEFTN